MTAISRLVEQRHLQRPTFGQRPDGGGAQRRDPIEAGRLELLVYAGLGDHAAIADQHDMLQGEALLELGDVNGERLGIAGVAFEHLDRDRTAVRRAQQAVDDLQLAFLAVAIVAELGERAAASLHVGRGHVVEHQRAVLEMLARQALLDGRLPLAEPIERIVKLVLVDGPEIQHRAQARSGGLDIEHARGRRLRGRRHNAVDQHGDHQLAAAIAGATQHAVQSDPAQRAQHGRYGAVRQAAAHDDRLSIGGDRCAAFQQRAQTFDELGRPIGQIGEGAFFDLAGVAIAFAQQDGRRRRAVGDRFDIHGLIISL